MDDTTGRVTPRSVDDETDIRTQEIREEIAQTRVEMSETIEAIQERLTPSNLVAQAGETVRNATTEKVKDMANTAGYAAERVMDTSFVQTVKSNPIPAAMIGIGTAWLLMNGRSQGTRRYRSRDYSRDYTTQRNDSGYRPGAAYDARTTSDYAANTYDASGAYDAGGAYETGGAYGAGRDWRVGGTGDVAVGTTGYAEYGSGFTGESGRVPEFGGQFRSYDRGGRQTMSFDRVVRENPLVVGAAAALVGVAIGLSLPASETENRLMGEARDNVVDRARGLASEAAGKVQDVAGQAVEAATQVRDAAKRATGAGDEHTGLQGGADLTASGSSELGGTSPRTPRGGRRTTNS